MEHKSHVLGAIVEDDSTVDKLWCDLTQDEKLNRLFVMAANHNLAINGILTVFMTIYGDIPVSEDVVNQLRQIASMVGNDALLNKLTELLSDE